MMRWVREFFITEEGMKFLKENGFVDKEGKWIEQESDSG